MKRQMGNRTTGLWSVLLGVTLLCCMSGATVFAAADIPDNLVIQKNYRQGMGESVGSVGNRQGPGLYHAYRQKIRV